MFSSLDPSQLWEDLQAKYDLFIELIRIIEESNTNTNSSNNSRLRMLLPVGNWQSQWNTYFAAKYKLEKDPEKAKDIYAEWIFQWMLQNMPEDCFLAKSSERIDNLWDIKWLMNQKGKLSYLNTLKTTNFTYIPRLNQLGYSKLSHHMGIVGWRWREKLSWVFTQISRLLMPDVDTSSDPQISS